MNSKLLFPAKPVSWAFLLALMLLFTACSSPEERAQAHYKSGNELLQAGEFEKAGLEFRNALKYNDKIADAWFGLAAVEEQKQNWPAVIDSMQRVIELDPNNFEARLKLAKLQLAASQLDQALKNVNAANDLKKEDSSVFALRAAILFRLNDREGARADAEHALAIDADNVDADAVLAADLLVDGNTKGALLYIDNGLSKDPNNLGLLFFKIKIFEDARDDKQLEAVLRQIIASHPEIKEMRRSLLAFLTSRKRNAEAETEMRAMVAADPDNTSQALEFISFIGRVKGAAEAYKELEGLIANKPEASDYRLALAQIDFSEKRTDTAIASLKAIIAKGESKETVQRARLLLVSMNTQLGRTEEAKTLINEILAGDAKNADALAFRANLSLEAGDADSAVADLREALNQQPHSVAFLVRLGHAHERQGAVGLAATRLSEAVKASNYNPVVALDYIAFLGRRGEEKQAELALNEALAHNPNDMRLLTALARLRLKKQDWVGAQAVADALKKIDDQSGVSEQIVGALLLGQKKYDQSIETLKSAYASAPDGSQSMYSLAFAYLQAGKISEAESFIQSILKANESNANAIVMMGSIKALQKKPQEAEAAYKLAIERQPANPIGYVALSNSYLAQNKRDEAEVVLRNGRKAVPRDLDINLNLAGLMELKNDTEGAIAIYEEQLQATPDALIVINNLASLLADYRTDAGSLETAFRLSQRLEALDVPQFNDTIGWVAYRRGDYRTALVKLEAAVDQLPELALIRYHLAMTYLALKREPDAKAQFAKADGLLKDGDPLKEKIRIGAVGINAQN